MAARSQSYSLHNLGSWAGAKNNLSHPASFDQLPIRYHPDRLSAWAGSLCSARCCRLGFGKGPLAAQDIFPRGAHARRIVPPWRLRGAVDSAVVAAAEVQCPGAIRVCLGGDAVITLNVLVIGLEVALGVVDCDGPESSHRHVTKVEGIQGFDVIVLDAA
jgi:hypothetical protein